jgi:long-chain acyl-CoA synthetase
MGKTLKELMDQSFALHASRTALRVLRPSGKGEEPSYEPISYAQLKEQRDQLAAGLARAGVQRGKRVGLLTDGGEEPLMVFLATDALGVCTVPLCLKSPPEALVHSLNRSQVEWLVVDRKGYEQFDSLRSRLSRLPRLVLTEGRAQEALAWEEVMAMGRHAAMPQVAIDPQDESKIVFTSGSSGLPKGVVQTHANIVANIEEVWELISLRDSLRFFKSAPDYHSMGILNVYYPLAKGWVLDLARSPDRVLSDIRLSEPQGFLTVPLILDKVYGNVRRQIEAGGLKGGLIQRAVQAKQKLARGRAGPGELFFLALVGRRIVGKIRAQLARRVGPNLELLIVGSAKADPEALDFFHEVLDIAAYEGYGTTECAPLIAANHLGGRKSGTVGRPLLEVKIVAQGGQVIGYGHPGKGEYRSSGGQAGELWVSGANVMRGYLDEPEQTRQVLVEDEGGKIWYRTGDLFSMDEEGFLNFQGRVGRQFKLRNGEFVNPELLERLFARVPLVEHVLVYGDQTRTFPLPLVAVDVEQARQSGIAGLPLDDERSLRQHPALAERLRQLMLAEAGAAGLPGYQRPQKIALLPEPLSEDTGTLTRGLRKVVPGAIVQRYRELIEEAYAR